MSQTQRAHLYRILTAVALLAAGYGLVSDTELPLWLGLAGAVLGTGTASAYTPTAGKRTKGAHRADNG